MHEISEMLSIPVVEKGVGSSIHNDFMDPLAGGALYPRAGGIGAGGGPLRTVHKMIPLTPARGGTSASKANMAD